MFQQRRSAAGLTKTTIDIPKALHFN